VSVSEGIVKRVEMFREDYILRIVRQATQILARILGLRQMHQYPEALALIDEMFSEFFGLSPGIVNHLSERDLIAMVTVGEEVDTGKLLILAELIKAEGDVFADQGNSNASYSRYLKSLNLFLEIARGAAMTDVPEEYSKIETIAGQLRAQGLPVETQAALLSYYETAGKFARAEDVLFQLIESRPRPEEVIEQGIAFYKRLQGKTDTELAAGNLPRDEVEKSLGELRELQKP